MLQFPLTRPLKVGLTRALQNPFTAASVATAAPDTLDDLAFWYDATDSTAVIDTGGNVESLSDLSGNDVALLQPFGDEFRVPLADNAFGTRKALRFPASGTHDYHPGGDVAPVAVPSVGTYFAVVKPSSVHNGGFLGRGADADNDDGTALRCLTNNDAVQFIICNGTSRHEAVFRNCYGAGTVLRCVARWDTTKLDFNLNGGNGALSGSDPVGTHALGDCSASSNIRVANTDQLFRGDIAVAGLFTRYLTDEEADQLAAYLESLYPD